MFLARLKGEKRGQLKISPFVFFLYFYTLFIIVVVTFTKIIHFFQKSNLSNGSNIFSTKTKQGQAVTNRWTL